MWFWDFPGELSELISFSPMSQGTLTHIHVYSHGMENSSEGCQSSTLPQRMKNVSRKWAGPVILWVSSGRGSPLSCGLATDHNPPLCPVSKPRGQSGSGSGLAQEGGRWTRTLTFKQWVTHMANPENANQKPQTSNLCHSSMSCFSLRQHLYFRGQNLGCLLFCSFLFF